MAAPQALTEAGLAVEYQDGGSRVIVRDVAVDGCPIRNRASEALASLLYQDRKIRALDISESNISDNGVAHLSLTLRQTDQLEELTLSTVGHTGLEFLVGCLRRCQRLRMVRVAVADVPNLRGRRQTVEASDYDTSAYAGEKKEGDEEEEEEAGEEAAEDGDEDPEEREKRKLNKLKKIFAENDYDSGDEAGAAKPADDAKDEKKPTSAVCLRLLNELLAAARKRENITEMEVRGDVVPDELRLDLARAMEEHVQLQERKLRAHQECGSRTSQDTLRDQIKELNEAIGAAEAADPAVFSLEDGDQKTRVGIRSYVGHRLFAALGEALFECQRYKSKENEALSTPQGEIAFISMYLRNNAAKFGAAPPTTGRAAGSRRTSRS